MRQILLFIVFLLSIQIANPAVIHGNVYDMSLDKLNNVPVEIDSKPLQRDITEDGFYKFNVKPGSYTITAGILEAGELRGFTRESITIEEEGDYVIDLILFPDLSEEDELADEQIELGGDMVGDDIERGNNTLVIIGIVTGIIALACLIWFLKHKQKKEPIINNLAKEVIDFIKKQGGRTTQKDIRRQFPSSEAKISLLITQLEKEQKINKLKKGRGNIIILK